MARIRSIKPGFFSNEDLAELPFSHRLCFAGLWTIADREGRLEDRPRRIKAALFPYDDVDVDEMLQALADKGFVTRYTADGAAYVAIPTFLEHQRPKSDESPSCIPAPVYAHPRGKVSDPRTYKGQGDLGSGQRTEGYGADAAPAAAPADGAGDTTNTADGAESQRSAEQFMALWNETTTPPIPHCRTLTSKRRRHIRARLTEFDLEQWRDIIATIERSAFCRGVNARGWIATFDWVIGSPDVAVKVLEGIYADRRPQQAELVSYDPSTYEWRCPHTPPCSHRAACAVVSMRTAS